MKTVCVSRNSAAYAGLGPAKEGKVVGWLVGLGLNGPLSISVYVGPCPRERKRKEK